MDVKKWLQAANEIFPVDNEDHDWDPEFDEEDDKHTGDDLHYVFLDKSGNLWLFLIAHQRLTELINIEEFEDRDPWEVLKEMKPEIDGDVHQVLEEHAARQAAFEEKTKQWYKDHPEHSRDGYL